MYVFIVHINELISTVEYLYQCKYENFQSKSLETFDYLLVAGGA